MKKLLVLGAGVLQIAIIKKAKDMGYFVLVADGNPNAPGLKFADKAIVANITSEEKMLTIAEEEKINGVIHPCSEVAMSVMGRINDELNLSGITKIQAVKATNKHLMRKEFEKYGAPSPRSILTQSIDDAWKQFNTKFESDAILKPSRNSGSRGIARISKDIEKDDFSRAYFKALEESRDNSVLIEQFIEGVEFSVEIIVWNHTVHVIQVTDKKTTGSPHFVELGHSQPSIFGPKIINKVTEAAIDGVKALGVDNCACHAEIKFESGKAYIIEIGARLGGDFISTELTHLSTGVDMVAAAIDCAMGNKPNLFPIEESKSACIRYFCPTPGKLKDITNLEYLDIPEVYNYEIYCKTGDVISTVTSSHNRSGHLIVVEKTPEKAIELAEKLINSVIFHTI